MSRKLLLMRQLSTPRDDSNKRRARNASGRQGNAREATQQQSGSSNEADVSQSYVKYTRSIHLPKWHEIGHIWLQRQPTADLLPAEVVELAEDSPTQA